MKGNDKKRERKKSENQYNLLGGQVKTSPITDITSKLVWVGSHSACFFALDHKKQQVWNSDREKKRKGSKAAGEIGKRTKKKRRKMMIILINSVFGRLKLRKPFSLLQA